MFACGFSKVSGGGLGIIGTNTIIVRTGNDTQAPHSHEVVSGMDFPGRNQYSNISVVKEIMHRVVLPYVASNERTRFSSHTSLLIHGKTFT